MRYDTRKISNPMRHSGTHAFHLAGKTVEILEWDHGDPWDYPIVKVRYQGETTWMNPKDFDEPKHTTPTNVTKHLRQKEVERNNARRNNRKRVRKPKAGSKGS